MVSEPTSVVVPFTVTVMEPDVAPAGTTTFISVAVALTTVAVTPLNFTVLFAATSLKFCPFIIIVSLGLAAATESGSVTGVSEVGLSASFLHAAKSKRAERKIVKGFLFLRYIMITIN